MSFGVQAIIVSLLLVLAPLGCGESATRVTADVAGTADVLDGESNSTDTAEVDTAESVDTAAPADTVDCSTPNEGCPCDPDTQKKLCCLAARHGLQCDDLRRVWMAFSDCGCWENPECRDPLYGLCSIVYPSTE